MEHNYNMERVVRHTEGLMRDNEISKGEAAAQMANYLDGLTAKDIMEEM